MAALTTLLRSCRQVSCSSFLRRASASSRTLLTSVRKQHGAASGETTPDSTFYELRTYKIKPASFPGFLKLTNEHMHLRMCHSKLIGYWVSDIGGLNEVVHIWEYESLAERKAVRAALAKDENWNATFYSKAIQMFDVQENCALKLLPWKPLQDKPFKEGGIYELRQYVLHPGSVFELENIIKDRDQACTDLGCGKLMGAWRGDIGDLTTFTHLWSWENGDKRNAAMAAILKLGTANSPSKIDALTPHMHSKIMVPTPFSPLN